MIALEKKEKSLAKGSVGKILQQANLPKTNPRRTAWYKR